MDKQFSDAFGPVLRQIRMSRNMTQEVLGGLVGVSSPYISMLESSRNYPSLEMIFRLASVLNVNPSSIIEAMEKRLNWKGEQN